MTLVRKCVSCGGRFNKFIMIRINKPPNYPDGGEITVLNVGDETYFPGRSCYVCCNMECFKKAKKSSRISRSFKCKICNDVYDKIENIISLSEN